MIVEMIYEAKCKHCLHFEYERMKNKDGNFGKKCKPICKNEHSENFKKILTLKNVACEKIEL